MRRPRVHVLENISEDILRSYLPDEWIVRRIQSDYGIDFEIEIVENELVTGKRIWVQLKGKEKIEVNLKKLPITSAVSSKASDKKYYEVKTVSFQAPINLLKYSLRCDFPLLLGLVDIQARFVYWLPLQDAIIENIESNNPSWRDQDSVVLHIPYRNNLTDDSDLNGFKWYSMEPARMRAFAMLHYYHHEIGYEAMLDGYTFEDGYVEEEIELIKSMTVVKSYLTLTLEQTSLFGENGSEYHNNIIRPLIEEGIEACDKMFEQIENGTVSFRPTAMLLGKITHAVNMLSTCIAMYQEFRKGFVLSEESMW